MRWRGFTLVEVVILALMMAAVAALVLVLAPKREVHVHVDTKVEVDGRKLGREIFRAARQAMEEDMGGAGRDAPGGHGFYEAIKTECMNNVRNLIGLLVIGDGLPKDRGGANLILYLVTLGDLEGEESLRLLFCPGDEQETFEKAGGEDAYRKLDLDRQDYGHLTSYAGRDQADPKCRVDPKSNRPVILVCDDGVDHHAGKGFVIGLSNGSAKFRHRFDDWKIDAAKSIEIGENSAIPELRCLRAD